MSVLRAELTNVNTGFDEATPAYTAVVVAERGLAPDADNVVDPETGDQVPSPRKYVVASAVPVPRRAEPTVPLAKLEAFNVVKFAPDTAPNKPLQVPVVTVPTEVNEEETTPVARVVPVNVLASTVIACHVLSPRKNVVLLAVPDPRRAVGTVPEPRLEAFNAVNAVPVPLNDVPETAPVNVIVGDVNVIVLSVVPERENDIAVLAVVVVSSENALSSRRPAPVEFWKPQIFPSVAPPALTINMRGTVSAPRPARTEEGVAATVYALVAFSDVAVTAAQVPSPRKYDELLAVPVPRRAVPTVPVDKLEAFNAVIAAPDPEIVPALTSDEPVIVVPLIVPVLTSDVPVTVVPVIVELLVTAPFNAIAALATVNV